MTEAVPAPSVPPPDQLLIVNADDFGLTPGVNRAIIEAFEHGMVTSTSMLAVAPAFHDAVTRWRSGDLGSLGIGVHFALVGEDPPLLSAAEVPTLVDRRGRLSRSWRQFLPRAACGRVDPADLRREFSAQLARIRQAGIEPTHVDTHQHLHLWPLVREAVFDVASSAGIDAVRVPRGAGSGPKGAGVAALSRRLARAATQRGFRQPDVFVGLDEAGHLDQARWAHVLKGLEPRAATEIGCHPGHAIDPERDRYRWGFDWPGELAALCDPNLRDRLEQRGFVLGSFAALGPPR